MEKIIKRTISLTTKKRDSRNKLFEEFYSHDKNNAVFEFTVENGVPTEDIIVLFHFKRTNRHLEVRGRVDNDKIIVNFDTSLIIKDEQVAGYIYYENGEKSNDVYRFMFDVYVSEIDKEHDLPVMEQESKRIVPLTDIVTKSEITELLKKIVANEKLYDDTEIKQQIESKADKETVQAISSKVQALETKADNDTIYNDSELRGQIATKADTQSVEEIAKRVETLEGKSDKDTVYNDTELRQAIEKKADEEALLQYLPKSELTPISEKIESIETNISGMATQQQLENYVSKNELEQKGYLTSADTHNFALKSEIPEVPNLDAVNEKIRELAEKPSVDLSHLATKKEIEDSHYLTREDITGLATDSKVEAVESRVQQLENKPPVDLSNLATKHEIEDVVRTAELAQVTDRVASLEARPQIDTSKLVTKEELEAKGYLSTAPDLSEYAKKSEIPPQFDGSALTERINALENKAISNGSYNDKPLLDKIHEVQESLKGFITQSSRYLTEHQSLAHLVTKDELARMGYINAHQSLEHLVTKEELENKHYLINQDVSNLATNAKVDAVEARVQTIENKPAVDLSPFVTKQELEAKQYLKDHQPLDSYVKKSELPPQTDTSTLVSKQELTSMNLVNAEALGEVSKKILEQKTKITALEEKSGYEIHGIGMPNGRVTASIGTTYVDMEVTNGALKWIKATGTGNTGWKVVEGDTGWVLGWQYKHDDNKNRMYFRRKNDVVHVKFEPEINDRSISLETNLILNSGGDGFDEPLSIDGFKPIDDIIQTIFKTSNEIYSTTAGAENSEGAQGTGAVMIQYEYQYNYTDKRQDKHGLKLNIVTSELGVAANHVNPFSYFTEDEWPTTLPTL